MESYIGISKLILYRVFERNFILGFKINFYTGFLNELYIGFIKGILYWDFKSIYI